MIKSMILCFVLVLAILNILKEAYRLYIAFQNEEQYESSDLRTVGTYLSIAYIITIIIFGL